MINALYRGKRDDKDEWVYGFLRCYKYENKYFIEESIEGKDWRVIPETVGQWTGLTDKNGTKIFDGDIIKYFVGKTLSGESKYINFCLKWSDSDHSYQCFAHGDKGYSYPEITMFSFGYNKDKFEIIGNIHDNFELLD